jgi:hypothetical protein
MIPGVRQSLDRVNDGDLTLDRVIDGDLIEGPPRRS